MKIDSFKDLAKLVALCQKQGITSIKVDGIELSLGLKPTTYKPKAYKAEVFPEEDIKVPQFNGITSPVPQVVNDTIETDELTEEQLLNWSSAGEAN